MFSLLLVLVDDLCLVLAGCDVDVADEQRDLVILVEVGPDDVCQLINVVRKLYRDRLALEARDRAAIIDVSADEVSLACQSR